MDTHRCPLATNKFNRLKYYIQGMFMFVIWLHLTDRTLIQENGGGDPCSGGMAVPYKQA